MESVEGWVYQMGWLSSKGKGQFWGEFEAFHSNQRELCCVVVRNCARTDGAIVWSANGVGRGIGVLEEEYTCLKGREGFGGFRFHWFQWRIFNKNVFDSSLAHRSHRWTDFDDLYVIWLLPRKDVPFGCC